MTEFQGDQYKWHKAKQDSYFIEFCPEIITLTSSSLTLIIYISSPEIRWVMDLEISACPQRHTYTDIFFVQPRYLVSKGSET